MSGEGEPTTAEGHIVNDSTELPVDEESSSVNVLPEGLDAVPSQFTNDPKTSYGFYTKNGQIIANEDDANVIAYAEKEAEETQKQKHMEAFSEIEKVHGGYLDAIKPFMEKYPGSFKMETDSNGNIFVVSETIKDEKETLRTLIFSKEKIFAILSLARYPNGDTVDPQPWIGQKQIDSWKIWNRPEVILDRDLTPSSHQRISREGFFIALKDVTDPTLHEKFIKEPLVKLAEQRKAEITTNNSVQQLKNEIANI